MRNLLLAITVLFSITIINPVQVSSNFEIPIEQIEPKKEIDFTASKASFFKALIDANELNLIIQEDENNLLVISTEDHYTKPNTQNKFTAPISTSDHTDVAYESQHVNQDNQPFGLMP